MNPESHSSMRTVWVPTSIKSETKAKFDALLKVTNKKTRRSNLKTDSKEKLLEDLQSTTASSENLQDNEVEKYKLYNVNEQSENYILSKFLNNQVSGYAEPNEETEFSEKQSEQDKTVSNIKPPVPRPRTKKAATMENTQSPTVSQATFEVTSPKIVKNSDVSISSNKTYNVEEIGDVLIHQSPLNSKAVIKTDNSVPVFLEKGNVEALSNNSDSQHLTHEIKKFDSNDKILTINTPHKYEISDITELKKNDSDDSITKETIKSESEKPIKRKKSARVKETEEKQTNQKTYNYENITEIVIHKTDRLQLNSLVVHPVIKIYIVDIATGKYIPKSDKTRPVVFFYENKDYDYISPVMTHTYNLQEKRILFPLWEEAILFNEDFEYFKDESHRIILFFELLDFISFSEIHQLNEKSCKKGWHHIAFAFLKLSAKNGVLNSGSKIRLQLYYPHQQKKVDPHICVAWTWWKNKKLEKYPSTLYVSIKPVKVPSKMTETFRSKTPIQGETSSKPNLYEEIKKDAPTEEINNLKEINNKQDDISPWTRKPHETCKLPSRCLASFPSSEDGCFVMKFSNNGHYLACAVHIEKLFYIKIFTVQGLKEVNKFPTHQEMIYDIKWSKDDSFLISASADNTVAIFNTQNFSFLQILPHPSFVYSCDINQENIIVSGCYDNTLRIWKPTHILDQQEYSLWQELDAHKGYITSTCFNKKFDSILSADSTGTIIEWAMTNENNWSFKRDIMILDLKQTIINQIILFPKGKKLLVHSRDSTIRVIDLQSGCVLQWLRGSINKRFQTFCTISACGTYVYSGSENGHLHIWNSKNGTEVASCIPFSPNNEGIVVHCVECHPSDNVVAISHYGTNLPILLYCYDTNAQVKINYTFKENGLTHHHKNELLSKEVKLSTFSSKQKIRTEESKRDLKEILQKMDRLINLKN